jgi:hypothetical protein
MNQETINLRDHDWLWRDGLGRIKLHDLAQTHGIYRVDLAFGSSVGQPEEVGIDIPSGSSRKDVAKALRSLADHLDSKHAT